MCSPVPALSRSPGRRDRPVYTRGRASVTLPEKFESIYFCTKLEESGFQEKVSYNPCFLRRPVPESRGNESLVCALAPGQRRSGCSPGATHTAAGGGTEAWKGDAVREIQPAFLPAWLLDPQTADARERCGAQAQSLLLEFWGSAQAPPQAHSPEQTTYPPESRFSHLEQAHLAFLVSPALATS